MTLVQHRNGNDNHNDLAQAGDSLRDDLLGFARYLADAVTSGDVTVDAAGIELADAAPGLAEREALGRAAELAEIQLGNGSLVTTLLRTAADGG
jgi:hypothetical protein